MKGTKSFLLAMIVILTIGLTGCGKYKLVKVDEEEKTKEVTEVSEVTEEPEEVVEEEPVVEEKEEPTATPASAKKSSQAASKDLSNDIYSFQIQIDDDVYQFPMTFDDFVAKGWEYDAGAYNESPKFEPNQYSTTETFKKNDKQIYGIVINFGMNTVPVEQCQVSGLKMEKYYLDRDEGEAPRVILPGGIERTVSTLDDIKAAYGEPSDTYDGTNYTLLTYTLDTYQEVELYVYKEENALMDIKIENIIPMEGSNDIDESQVSDEIPDVVNKYVAPTSLGTSLEDFIAEYDGDLYKLPCPVSEFEKNGWKIVESDSNMIVKGQSYGWITLMKNNQKFSTTADNYADNATAVNNCFISEISAGKNTTNLPLKLCNGLELGMKKDDALKILKKEKDVEESKSSSYTEYEIPLLDSSTDGVEVLISDEDNTVISLSIDHGYYAKKDFLK